MAKIFPEYAINCIKTIESHGFEAWFVGGCVRDVLLSRDFDDIDIATNALPSDITKIFERTIPTGIDHGTVTVLLDNQTIEVTTYRSDGLYEDNRHPKNVVFETDIKSDLSRRDFTINAFALNWENELLDVFEGKKDLENRIIRCVGEPEKRFSEDALRILRAYRFSSVLNFNIEENTLKACMTKGKLIKNISGERILTELKKLVLGDNFDAFIDFVNSGFLEFCGICPIKEDLSLLKITSKKQEIRLPIFLVFSNVQTEKMISVLKPDKALINSIAALREMSQLSVPSTKTDIKMLLNKYSKENVIMYFEYLKAIGINAKNLYLLLTEIEEKCEPYLISHLAINGEDLMKLGLKGKEIGDILNRLCLYVIENPSKNNPQELLKFNH